MPRFQAVDVFRVLAILAVIALHTAKHEGPGAVGTAFDAALFLNQLERFAVPLFFILSGYFWSAKCHGRDDYLVCSLRLARRVLLLFAAWCAVYFLAAELATVGRLGAAGAVADWSARWSARHGGYATLLLQGSKVHLWFLPARIPALAALGPLVLGIYASHYLFVDGLRALPGIDAGPGGGLRYVLLVFLLSLACSWMLSRMPLARRAGLLG